MMRKSRLTQHRLQCILRSLSGSATNDGGVESELEAANEDCSEYLFKSRYLV